MPVQYSFAIVITNTCELTAYCYSEVDTSLYLYLNQSLYNE